MTDPKTLDPKQYLEYMQEYYANQAGLSLNQGRTLISCETIKEVAEALKNEIELLALGVDPELWLAEVLKDGFPLSQDQGLLAPLVKMAKETLSKDERDEITNIPIGIIHIPLFNAARTCVPKGGYIIVVNYNLISGLNIVFRNLIDVLLRIFGNFLLTPEYFQEQKELALNFSHTLQRQILLETTATHEIRRLDPQQGLWTWRLAWAAQLFVLLHEFGHHFLRHHDVKMMHPASMPMIDINYYTQSQEQEFEADAWAAKRLTTLPPEIVEDMRTALPILFYSFQICEDVFGLNAKDSGTHPPHLDRLERIYSIAFGISSISEVSQVKDLDKVFGWMKSAI